MDSPPPAPAPARTDAAITIVVVAIVGAAVATAAVPQVSAVFSVQDFLFVSLITGAVASGAGLVRALRSGRIGFSTRRSSLTGETAWSLTPAAAYLLLIVLFAALLVSQVGPMEAPDEAAAPEAGG